MPPTDLARLIDDARAAPADVTLAARVLPLLDLTSLRDDETTAEIEALCARALQHGVAAVCIYPQHLRLARARLEGSAVRLATVVAFPHGGDDIDRAADEVAAAVADGADEVDIVAPLQAIGDGDIGLVGELVELCRTAAGERTTLKLILETGVLHAPELITATARAAVMAGIDFLKTSTGKAEVGATLEAAALCLMVIGEADGRVGFKAAGGIRTTADVAGYVALADRLLGADWIRPERFRIGASGLLDDLLLTLGRTDTSGLEGGSAPELY